MLEVVLNLILESIPQEIFISKIQETEYNFFLNEQLVWKTVNHLKGLRSIVSSTLKIQAQDNYISDKEGERAKLHGSKKDVAISSTDGDEGSAYRFDSYMIFTSCVHSYPVLKEEIKVSRIYCNKCEEEVETHKGKQSLTLVLKRWNRMRNAEKDPAFAQEFQNKVKYSKIIIF